MTEGVCSRRPRATGGPGRGPAPLCLQRTDGETEAQRPEGLAREALPKGRGFGFSSVVSGRLAERAPAPTWVPADRTGRPRSSSRGNRKGDRGPSEMGGAAAGTAPRGPRGRGAQTPRTRLPPDPPLFRAPVGPAWAPRPTEALTRLSPGAGCCVCGWLCGRDWAAALSEWGTQPSAHVTNHAPRQPLETPIFQLPSPRDGWRLRTQRSW